MLMRAEGLYKGFGGSFLAIEDVSLSFEEGVLTSVIGPNGAGKTTLINILSGSLRHDRGSISFQEMEVGGFSIEERIAIGICRSFQITNIFPNLTVMQNIEIPLIAYHKMKLKFFSRLICEDSLKKEALGILNEIGLSHQQGLKASHLSHGEQRQLEIGIALATHPKIIFLDEPTQGMNKMEKGSIMQNVVRFSEEGVATFVIVEHDMDLVFSVSDRIVVLHSGRVIADGTPEDIRNHELVRKVYLGEEL
jgi:branched-chain amino acid transport system ATP-binding protein